MTKEFNKDLLCKDCKYVEADFMTRLTKYSYGFKCTLPEAWVKPEYDPVIGVTKEGYFHTARLMRGSHEACGPQAKQWVPNSTKKVFLYLKKG